jgi:dTDP-4-amino-4,6-dideoxygalactose transaminase
MTIPIFTLARQYRSIKKEIDTALRQVLTDSVFILGKNVAAFEKEFASYIGVPHAAGVASGTDALLITLRALDIGRGDEVIVPANAYPTAFPTAMSGATVKLVDCGEDGNINPNLVEQTITKKTRAIIPVHLYGNPADLAEIRTAILNKRSIAVIEDAAQAHGTEVGTRDRGQETGDKRQGRVIQNTKYEIRNTKLAGSVGDVGCFSFYPTKNLGAYGDGGMVVSKNKKFIDRIRRLRMYGEEERYRSTEVSGVSRLDELQAAILRVKLRHLVEWNRRRRTIASEYMRRLHGIGDIRFVNNESENGNQEFRSCFHLFVIRTKYRDRLKTYLTKQGIGSGIHYPVPVHLTDAFRNLKYKVGDFPIAEQQAREILSLPMYPELTYSEAETVASAIRRFFRL